MGDAPAPRRWSDLRRRVLSAVLLAPLAILCIWLGAQPFLALIGLMAAGLLVEWAFLCGRRPVWGVAGFLYIGMGALAMIWLRQGSADAGRANVLFVVLVVWASDIGAYTAGRIWGGPKLAPSLSPSKTWAGAIGGLVAAILIGQGAALLLTGAPWGRAAIVAGLLGVASQAGDLIESAVKRHFGVKDSGRLIPGHGGLLDRLDGLLAAAPAAAVLAMIVGRGGLLWQ